MPVPKDYLCILRHLKHMCFQRKLHGCKGMVGYFPAKRRVSEVWTAGSENVQE
jgi:hypothetical protein